jgi:hypothetical protein
MMKHKKEFTIFTRVILAHIFRIFAIENWGARFMQGKIFISLLQQNVFPITKNT